MKTLNVPNLFPQLLIRQSRMYETAQKFHGLILPVEPAAREAFYRGLPSVGYVVQETSRVWRKKNLDLVLPLALQTLRENAARLSRLAPAQFELETLQVLKTQIAKAFNETAWPVSAESLPTKPERQAPVILIADDDPVSRFIFCQELRKAGFDPRPVEDGAEALLMAPICQPDLILLDIQMESVDGIDSCTWLKKSKLTGTAPVIFLSGDTCESTTASAIQAGGVDFIAKPINRQTFLSCVRAHLTTNSLPTQTERATISPSTLMVDPEKVILMMDSVRVHALPSIVRMETKPEESRKDLAGLLRMVTWIFAPYAARKKVSLHINVPETGLLVACDEIRIQRVLENLLSNALNFAPPCSTVTVAARQEKGKVRIWVDDEGPGVPLAEQSILFSGDESEFKKFPEREVDYDSGLIVCGEIVADHGGEIFMQNRREGGSHFEFWLPAPTINLVSAATALTDKSSARNVTPFANTLLTPATRKPLQLSEVA